MRSPATTIICLCFVLSGSSPGRAQTPAALSATELAAVDRAVRAEMSRHRAPAVSLAIVRDGQIAWAGGFGLANVERGTPATEHTLYRTASLAKPMTATAVMQLVESGKMDLDAPIQRYCTAFPEKPWPVTARHLLGHTSGTRHPTDAEDEQTKHYANIADALPVFAGDRLLHQPGTRSSYSTYGYMVLACAIEGAAGMPYMQWLQQRVLEASSMKETYRDTVPYEDPRRAAGYRTRGGGVGPSLRVDTSFKLAAGGLVSTTHDLARFAIATLDGTLVSGATRAQMWEAIRLADGTATPFGLGWQVAQSKGRPVIMANGQQEETSTLLLLFPERNAAIVLMSNLERSVRQLLVPLAEGIRAATGLQ